jgi:hypothetical protein
VILETLAVAALLHLPPAERDPHPSRAQVNRVTSAASLPPRGWAAFARCVEHRESKGHAGVVNHGSGAAGLFQFMPAWRHGLPYMVAHRLHAHGMSKGAAAAVRRDLASKPINHWPAIYQRVGFAEVIATGGWRAWTGGHGCNALAAS